MNRYRTPIIPSNFKIVGYTLDSIYQDVKKQINIEIEGTGHIPVHNPDMDRPFTALTYWFYRGCKNTSRWFCMCGGVGSGKTTIMKAVYNYIKKIQTVENGRQAWHAPFCCKYITSGELAEMMKDKATWNLTKSYQVLFVDDIGQEPTEIMDFGNEVSPFRELINDRYNNNLGLVFSTNLTASQLKETYGERAADRLRECCFICPNLGESMRRPFAEEGCPF